MRFFSGFGFEGEQGLFKNLIKDTDFDLYGFSMGAIDAFEYALSAKERFDRLTLFSPSFFQEESGEFRTLQLRAFMRRPEAYMKNFYKNSNSSRKSDIIEYTKHPSKEELERLLWYRWDRERLCLLQSRGVKLRVYIGGNDRIVNPESSLEFFRSVAEVYYINKADHLLRF